MTYHEPVMLREVLESLHLHPGGIYVDGTLGGAGHAREILAGTAPDGILIGIDRDDDALEEARRTLNAFGTRAVLVRGNYADMDEILSGLGIAAVDGIFLDLGVSSHQLDSADRGFSFSAPAPLDMRMDRRQATTAGDLVNSASLQDIEDILRRFGEEPRARRIARAIGQARSAAPIRTTDELARLVVSALPAAERHGRTHAATRTFQALRIAVNDELASLEKGIVSGIDRLNRGGRFSIMTFHSLEDRMVKDAFRDASRECVCPPGLPVCRCDRTPRLTPVTRKPVRPAPDETARNPRARSAKLRTAERI